MKNLTGSETPGFRAMLPWTLAVPSQMFIAHWPAWLAPNGCLCITISVELLLIRDAQHTGRFWLPVFIESNPLARITWLVLLLIAASAATTAATIIQTYTTPFNISRGERVW